LYPGSLLSLLSIHLFVIGGPALVGFDIQSATAYLNILFVK
jgi:hypothetical protein